MYTRSAKRRRLLEESSESYDEKQLKRDLLRVFTIIYEDKGEFAVGGVCSKLPSAPGIEIHGYGTVSLPVTDVAIKDLRNYFHQAPNGMKELVLLMDTAVLDSYLLERFWIRNPKFIAGVNKLIKEVQNQFDCSLGMKVTSHLDKLLLFEPGGHYKLTQDTQNHPGMFASLIVQLPSIFMGGDFVIKHGCKEKRIPCSIPLESPFTCLYAAYYTDCELELTEITSGYSIALIYSICCDDNSIIPSPPDISSSKLAGKLQQLGHVVPYPSILAWGLDHHYSTKSFLEMGVKALKRGDKLIYSSLQGVNAILEENRKIELFIVQAKRVDKISSACTMEYGRRFRKIIGARFKKDSECETQYELTFIDVDGKLWKGSWDFNHVSKHILNVGKDDDEFWGKCHEGEWSRSSENKRASKTNWYYRYLLVFLPKEKVIEVVYNNSVK